MAEITREIDWHQQWQTFAPNFYDGRAHIDLAPHGELLLEPGSGFGDLSHPTTQLVLDLMKPYVAHKKVLDIGCGSGILTLASILLGAQSAYGIDIDSSAILHAQQNAHLNKLSSKAFFSTHCPPTYTPSLLLMNMLFTEQKQAFSPHYTFEFLITSGILQEEREAYLDWASQMHWKLVTEKREGLWLATLFSNQRIYDK